VCTSAPFHPKGDIPLLTPLVSFPLRTIQRGWIEVFSSTISTRIQAQESSGRCFFWDGGFLGCHHFPLKAWPGILHAPENGL
jgi:hypothetical protein